MPVQCKAHHGAPICKSCFTGVAGYTWVGVLHTLLGFSFRATLLAANATSAAWLLAFHLLLKQPAGVSAFSAFSSKCMTRSTGAALSKGCSECECVQARSMH